MAATLTGSTVHGAVTATMIPGISGHGIIHRIPSTIRFMITGIHGTGILPTTIRRSIITTRTDTATGMDIRATGTVTMAATQDLASTRTSATTRRTIITLEVTTMVGVTDHAAVQRAVAVSWQPTRGAHVQLLQPVVAAHAVPPAGPLVVAVHAR